MTELRRIAIVTPVLNDWPAFAMLTRAIEEAFDGTKFTFCIFAVDDGSAAPFDPATVTRTINSCIESVEVLELALNLGHQRAIAVGLCAVASQGGVDAVVVMDSDGEDRPSDIAALIAAADRNPGHVILAERAERSEAATFRIGYLIYRSLFRILTGRAVRFGNFSLLPLRSVKRLVHMPELWNNLPASILRSRLPMTAVPTNRGRRFIGESRMGGMVGLVAHGLSAMSVYTDLIFVRVLLWASGIGLLSLLGIIAVFIVRFTTSLAIPGWATAAAGDFAIILFLTIVIVVSTSLMMLASRSLRPVIPIIDWQPFVAERRRGPERT
jgi:hypothetical protein